MLQNKKNSYQDQKVTLVDPIVIIVWVISIIAPGEGPVHQTVHGDSLEDRNVVFEGQDISEMHEFWFLVQCMTYSGVYGIPGGASRRKHLGAP